MTAGDTSSPIAALSAIVDRSMLKGTRQVPAMSAAAFRVGFGVLGIAAAVRFAAKGWIYELYIEPAHHFTYTGFWWVQPWPGWGMYVHFGLLGLASLCVAIGFKYRLSIAAFFLLFTYVELIDKTTYLNHYYLVSLLSGLMVFMPLNRWWSIDAWRDPVRRSATVPVWTVWTLRAQLSVVYLYGGIAKLNPDWLLDAQPLRIWLYNSGDVPVVGPVLGETWVAYAMSYGGAAFDLTIVVWLLWNRSRPAAYVVLCVFHIMTWILFPIGMFPWIMIVASLVFFSYNWPNQLLGKITPAAERSPAAEIGESNRGRLLSRAALVALMLFALLQVVVPLRHWVYPGNVRWNEEGYRFSWRIMLTEKAGHVRFRVADPKTGHQWVVSPEEYLTPVQAERMAYQPDMILWLARLVAEDFVSGDQRPKVHADAFVAFNGRSAARLIDPATDLGQQPTGIRPKSWVLPEPMTR